MSDNKNLKTRDFDPMVCGDSCCESLKWECNPQYCYPILAKRVFSCTELQGTPLQSTPFLCEFITDIPKSITGLNGKDICVESVESITFKCLGLRQYSNGTTIPNTINENINFVSKAFTAVASGICTGTPPNNVDIYSKYLLANYNSFVSKNDLCNQENCELSDGIMLNVNFSTDQYGIYDLEIKVKARLKNDTTGIGKFTATVIVPDPPGNAGAGDTNFLLSELGFGLVNFYGNVCFPISKPCDIYKTFSGNFTSPCVSNTQPLRRDTDQNYVFNAHTILCFCPTETIEVIIEELMGVSGVLNPDKCVPVKPCDCSE
ncbi:hypothetical protein [Romboutsia sp.]|uniref:hypothetical protein n=1 Tax=Romboutsia sp. TaxID=1965302 RepID=UPI003F3C5B5C